MRSAGHPSGQRGGKGEGGGEPLVVFSIRRTDAHEMKFWTGADPSGVFRLIPTPKPMTEGKEQNNPTLLGGAQR